MLHRHATDAIALVAGTIFAGITAVWLLMLTDTIDIEQAWIGGPVILIVAGVLGLLVALTPSRPVVTTATRSEESDVPEDQGDPEVDEP